MFTSKLQMSEKSKIPIKSQSESFRFDLKDSEGSKKNIKVACRVRPLNAKESLTGDHLILNFSHDLRSISLESPSSLSFRYDRVFSPEISQKEVYEEIGKPIVDSVMEGFNGTILAYGQTSSGKTYTIMGPDINDPIRKGLIPRMVSTLFADIKESPPTLEFSVKVAYCEIYLEKIRDLLFPSKNNLKVSEDRARGIYIRNLSEEYVSNADEVFSLFRAGNKNREVAATLMNEESSRSHTIFMISIVQSNTSDFSVKTGKMFIVDLAGSEKLAKSPCEGKRLDETKNINKSLSTLGNVIFSLTDGKSTHIPYRDSKLTRVLQDSLGGNSKTSLIITCAPSGICEAETISTLRFGLRAKAVKNMPKVNKELSVAELKILLEKANECVEIREKKIEWLEQKLGETGVVDNFENERKSMEKNRGNHESSQEMSRAFEVQVAKNNGLMRENDKLNTKIANLHSLIQDYEDRLQDAFDNSERLEVKTSSQEKQILCLLETNKTLDKKIEEMQSHINKISVASEKKSFHSLLEKIKSFASQPPEKLLEFCNNQLESISSQVVLEPLYIESNENKVYSLEKNLEQLNLMYKILSHKYQATRGDLSIYEKKSTRKGERLAHLEKSLQKAIELSNNYKHRLSTQQREEPDGPSPLGHCKIKKTIKGGNAINILCPYSINT